MNENKPYGYLDWAKYVIKYGRGGTARSHSWLLAGCPRCKQKRGWELTNDGWAYCPGCNLGVSTWGIWTNRALEWYDENGHHCFMCHGFGYRGGEVCDECMGRVTQPFLNYEDVVTLKGLDHDSVMISPELLGKGRDFALSIDSCFIAGMDVIVTEALPPDTMLLVRKGKTRVRGLVRIEEAYNV